MHYHRLSELSCNFGMFKFDLTIYEKFLPFERGDDSKRTQVKMANGKMTVVAIKISYNAL